MTLESSMNLGNFILEILGKVNYNTVFFIRRFCELPRFVFHLHFNFHICTCKITQLIPTLTQGVGGRYIHNRKLTYIYITKIQVFNNIEAFQLW